MRWRIPRLRKATDGIVRPQIDYKNKCSTIEHAVSARDGEVARATGGLLHNLIRQGAVNRSQLCWMMGNSPAGTTEAEALMANMLYDSVNEGFHGQWVGYGIIFEPGQYESFHEVRSTPDSDQRKILTSTRFDALAEGISNAMDEDLLVIECTQYIPNTPRYVLPGSAFPAFVAKQVDYWSTNRNCGDGRNHAHLLRNTIPAASIEHRW